MEELLRQFVGKKIDVSIGTTAVFRGRVQDASGGVVALVDDDERTIFLAIEKIASVCECKDNAGRPGFIG